MKIMYINTYYYPTVIGGAEVILQNLAEGMVEKGHDVYVIVTTDVDDYERMDKVNGVNVIYIPLKNLYWNGVENKKTRTSKVRWFVNDISNNVMAVNVRKIISNIRPDLVHTHNLSGWSTAIWETIHFSNVPIVHTLHDYYLLCLKNSLFKDNKICEKICTSCQLMKSLNKTRSKYVNTVIGVSDRILDLHLKNGLFDLSSREIVHNNKKAISINHSQKIRNDSYFVFGYIGALKQEKGVDKIIQYFSKLDSNKYKLLVAGTGETYFQEYLYNIATDNVVFLGRVTPNNFFSQIDCCIVPSIWEEPFGIVIVEAFQHGVPVMVSRYGGIPEIVEHNINGFIFNVNSEDSFIDYARKISDKQEYESLKTEAIKTGIIYSQFSEWIERHETIYNHLLYKGQSKD